MDNSKRKVVVIQGPTASGKTKIALEIAKKMNGELINADSRQVYKYLRVGTDTGNIKLIRSYELGLPAQAGINNKFSPPFRRGLACLRRQGGGLDTKINKVNKITLPFYSLEDVPIHLISFLELDTRFSAFEFKTYAEAVIEEIFSRGKQPIVVGGTGFYIDALTGKLNLDSAPPNQRLRDELEDKSVKELQDILVNDFGFSLSELNESDRANPRRLVRRIELLSFEVQANHTPNPLSKGEGEKASYGFDNESEPSRIPKRRGISAGLNLDKTAKISMEKSKRLKHIASPPFSLPAVPNGRKTGKVGRWLACLRRQEGGQLKSERDRLDTPQNYTFEFHCPEYAWEELQKKIEHRVEQMFSENNEYGKSIITETKEILEMGYSPDCVALQTMGYREVVEFLDQIDHPVEETPWSLQQMQEEIIQKVKTAHRQYAKRQRVWFERSS